MQPVVYAYDRAGRLASMKSFRVAGLTIASDPMTREDGDETLWSYDEATGLFLSKTYPDLHHELYGYDTMNRLTSKTTARQVDDRETPLSTTYVDDDRSSRLLQVCHNDKIQIVYYNYRYYNTQDGCWINRDSIAEQGGVNLYGYAGNRVSWVWDELGQISLMDIAKSMVPQVAGYFGFSWVWIIPVAPPAITLNPTISVSGNGKRRCDKAAKEYKRQITASISGELNIGVGASINGAKYDPRGKGSKWRNNNGQFAKKPSLIGSDGGISGSFGDDDNSCDESDFDGTISVGIRGSSGLEIVIVIDGNRAWSIASDAEWNFNVSSSFVTGARLEAYVSESGSFNYLVPIT